MDDGNAFSDTHWDRDELALLELGRRRAWCVAGAGWVAVMACCCSLAVLMPLKRVEPFVIRVDSSTGIVDVVPAFRPESRMDEAVTRFLVAHYISVCERFLPATAESDFEECSAFHGPRRNQAWYAQWQTANADSPLNLHRDGSEVRAQVQAVSFLAGHGDGPEIAQVRYIKWQRRSSESPPVASHWFATVRYDYSKPSNDLRRRSWNPLGFRVEDFGAEEEVAPDPGHESSGNAR